MGFILNKINQGQGGGGVFSRVAQSPAQVTPQSVIEKLSAGYKDTSSNLENFSIGTAKSGFSLFKGMSQIGENIGRGILGGVEKLTGLPVTPPETYSEAALQAGKERGEFLGTLLNKENLEAKGGAQTLGKLTGDVVQFFIPASKINAVEKILAGGIKLTTISKLTPIIGAKAAEKVSRAASLGTKITVRAAEGGGIIALQTGGDVKQTLTGSGVGAVFPAAGAVLRPTLKYAGNFFSGVGKRLAGSLAGGRGTSVIDEIVKDPRAAMEGLSGKSLDILTKDARILKEAAVNIKAEAGKEYSRVVNNLQEIYENEGKSFDKGTEINKITDLLEQKFGIMKAGKIAEITGEAVEDAGKLDYNSSRFLPKESTIIDRAMNIVKGFRDPLSPKTLESLASKIDKLKSQSPSAVEVNSAVHTITSSLRESVAKMGEQAGYTEGAELARNFAQAMDKLDDFTAKFRATAEDLRPGGVEVTKIGELRKGQAVILPETEKTKIIQDISTLFSGNKDADKETLRKLVFGGQAVLSREAGRTLATATEKSSGKLGDFFRETIIAPILSPTAVGKIVARTALSYEKVSKFLQALKKLDPAKRASVIKLISENNK